MNRPDLVRISADVNNILADSPFGDDRIVASIVQHALDRLQASLLRGEKPTSNVSAAFRLALDTYAEDDPKRITLKNIRDRLLEHLPEEHAA